MRFSLRLFAVGFGVFIASFAVACSDDGNTTSNTGGAGGTGGTGGGSGGMGAGGENTGGMGGMGTGGAGGMGGMGTGGMGGGGAGGSGGSGMYTTCSDCTDGNSGAPTKECKSQFDACQADPDCVKIYDCSYAQCTTDAMGGCCTVDCWKDSGASMAAWTKFKALDGCVYCTTCKSLCSMPGDPIDATGYCSNIMNDGAMCPP